MASEALQADYQDPADVDVLLGVLYLEEASILATAKQELCSTANRAGEMQAETVDAVTGWATDAEIATSDPAADDADCVWSCCCALLIVGRPAAVVAEQPQPVAVVVEQLLVTVVARLPQLAAAAEPCCCCGDAPWAGGIWWCPDIPLS